MNLLTRYLTYGTANIKMEYNNTMTGNVGLIWFDSKDVYCGLRRFNFCSYPCCADEFQLENEGYDYKGRVDYKDLCNLYEKMAKSSLSFRKTDLFLY